MKNVALRSSHGPSPLRAKRNMCFIWKEGRNYERSIKDFIAGGIVLCSHEAEPLLWWRWWFSDEDFRLRLKGLVILEWFCASLPCSSSLLQTVLCVQGELLKQKSSPSLTAGFGFSVCVSIKIRGACLKCVSKIKNVLTTRPVNNLYFKLLRFTCVTVGSGGDLARRKPWQNRVPPFQFLWNWRHKYFYSFSLVFWCLSWIFLSLVSS